MKIVKSPQHLPATIEGLAFKRIVGRENLKAQKALLMAVDLAGARAAKSPALEDTQDLADYMLDIDVRMGEVLAAEPLPDKRASSAKGTCSLPRGVSKKVSHQAQTLAGHRDVVAQVSAKARETGSIPMASKIYKIIKRGSGTKDPGAANSWPVDPGGTRARGASNHEHGQ